MKEQALPIRAPVRERNATIDVAKGMAILLVVFVHNPLLMVGEGLLQRVIYALPLPMFFAISGMFFRSETSLSSLVRSRAASLLKPYFVVLLALAGIKLLMQQLGSAEGAERIDQAYFAGILYGTGPTIDWTPLWYLPSLFVSSLCLWAVLRVVPTRSHATLAMLSLALLAAGVLAIERLWNGGICVAKALPVPTLPGWPWSVDLVPVTTSFMLLGFALAPWLRSFSPTVAGLALALTAFTAAQLVGDRAMDLNCRSYGNLFLSTVQVLTGGYLMLGVSWLTARLPVCGRVLAYIGSGTIFILLFHAYIAGTSIGLLTKGAVSPPLAAGLSFLAAALGPLVVMEMAKRHGFMRVLLLPGSTAHRKDRQANDTHR